MKKAKTCCSVLLLSFSILVASQEPTHSDKRPDDGLPWNEVWALRGIFAKSDMRVKSLSLHYDDGVKHDIIRYFEAVGREFRFDQYFVYTDVNPDCQLALIGFYSPANRLVVFFGSDLISSGNPELPGHFATPTGIFANTTEIIGYRALGTRNDDGWMGLGEKGARVWDFGWQLSYAYRKGRLVIQPIRFQIHSTDPVFGEALLGKAESKGCVRISNRLNWILDHYGLLDHDYEIEAKKKKISWLLRRDREPVAHAGRYLITGDSRTF